MIEQMIPWFHIRTVLRIREEAALVYRWISPVHRISKLTTIIWTTKISLSLCRTCFVCRSAVGFGLQTVSSEDRYWILLKKNMFVSEGSRCCPEHTTNRRLASDAIDRIVPLSVQYKEFDSNDVQVKISTWQMFFQEQKRFDFDDDRSMRDDEYMCLMSLSKEQFDDLIDQV